MKALELNDALYTGNEIVTVTRVTATLATLSDGETVKRTPFRVGVRGVNAANYYYARSGASGLRYYPFCEGTAKHKELRPNEYAAWLRAWFAARTLPELELLHSLYSPRTDGDGDVETKLKKYFAMIQDGEAQTVAAKKLRILLNKELGAKHAELKKADDLIYLYE
jgi:hypothetical protein